MDSKKEILALLPRIVPEEERNRDGSISGYTIGEDGKLFQGGKYANIQYDTKYLLWRLDLPYDEVCECINILYENFGGKTTLIYAPMPCACIDGSFYWRNLEEIQGFYNSGIGYAKRMSVEFPYWNKTSFDELKTMSEDEMLLQMSKEMRSQFKDFGLIDNEKFKKILDNINHTPLLESIRKIFASRLNKGDLDEVGNKFIKDSLNAIDLRIKEIGEGKSYIGRLTKKSKSVFVEEPQFKPKKDVIEGYLNDFVSTENDKRPMLCGVYHDGKNGYAVASDGYIFAAVSSVYDEKNKGISVYPDGKKIKEEEGKLQYPNWSALIPKKENLKKINLNLNDLWKFATKLSNQNSVKAGISIKDMDKYMTYPYCRLAINTEWGWTSYPIGYFLKLISLAIRLGDGQLYANIEHLKYFNTPPQLIFITNEKKPSYLILQPCVSDVEYEGQSVIAEDYYGYPTLYEYFYEGDKQGKQENKKNDSRMRMIQLQAKAAVAKLKLLEGKK